MQAGFEPYLTVDLPDELLIAAKKRAAEERLTLRELLVRGLRRELQARRNPSRHSRRIRWAVARGGLPPGLDVADRERMHDWLTRQA